MQNNPPNVVQLHSFQTTQHTFASYIRNPQTHPAPPDVAPERMAMYRELFFNNVESFLSTGFPVLRAILNDAQWLNLAEDFFANHQNHTPYFSEISEEFLEFLQSERENPEDYPFLLELAHYEWVEMALAISQEQLPPVTEYIDDFMGQKISLSPLAWILAYQYPVHEISAEFLPTEPPEQPTLLCVYRGWDDDVHFMQISAMSYRLLQRVTEQPNLTVEHYLNQLIEETQHPNPEVIVSGGLDILQKLFNKSVIAIT